MRTIFLHAITVLFAFTPFIQADAKPPGDYDPGTTFKLTVTERSSIKISQFATNDNASIPKGIPKFNKGQLVKFTIGKKSELKASGMSMPILRADNYSNIYGVGKEGDSKTYVGILSKKGRPELLVLTFSIISREGFSMKYQTVSYTLE